MFRTRRNIAGHRRLHGRQSATVTATVGGPAFGVLTNLTQGWPPGARNQLADPGAAWSTAAFAAGAQIAVAYAAIGLPLRLIHS
ncbi:DUF6518 family protein [Streptomyces sp. NPDC090075]|uniref:DUF6518 family protein n=1 Tax=Streptomyces sp. NPDC090075 TaxID=3365937 RepID=UPI00380FC9BA